MANYQFNMPTKVFLSIFLLPLFTTVGLTQPRDKFEPLQWKNPFQPDAVDKAIETGMKFLLKNQKEFCGIGGICKINPSPLRDNLISRTISICYLSPFGAGPSSYKKTNLYTPKTKKVSHIYLGFFLTQEVKAVNGFNKSFNRKQDIEFLERLKMNTKKNLLQHSHLKLIYYLKQNTLLDISKRFFGQGRLIFIDKDSFRLIHTIPLIAAFSVLAVLIFSPLIIFCITILPLAESSIPPTL